MRTMRDSNPRPTASETNTLPYQQTTLLSKFAMFSVNCKGSFARLRIENCISNPD